MFLGLISFYRRWKSSWISDYSGMAGPLTELLKGKSRAYRVSGLARTRDHRSSENKDLRILRILF